MAGRVRSKLFPRRGRVRSSAATSTPGRVGHENRRRWYRRKAVSIPVGVFAGLLVIGAIGNIVDPPKKTVLRADGGDARATSTTVGAPATTTALLAAFPDARTKTSLCRYNGPLPDHACTPGALNPAVTQATIADTICTSGYTGAVRPAVTESDRMKQQVGPAYGVTDTLGEYQGDHLIPLELGGAADDPANFWDEPNRQVLADGTVVTSDEKDALETTLKTGSVPGR